MAIDATVIWEARATATASMVNGGGFKPGASGTDYSKQDAAQYALTGVTSGGAGNTVLTASAAADMVGNVIHTVSGTNFTNNSWFEITSVSVGASITCSTNSAGASISTGVGVSGVMNVGGALSFNSTLDDDFFEQMIGGQTLYMKNGSFSLGENISVASTSSSLTNPCVIIGYNSTRGDNPTGSSRPTWNFGVNAVVWGPVFILKYLSITGTGTTVTSIASGSGQYHYCKITNTSTTAARLAISCGSTIVGLMNNIEAVSQNGTAIANGTGGGVRHVACYAHDSDTGFSVATQGYCEDCIAEGNLTAGFATTSSSGQIIRNCTAYGREGKVGIGISINAGTASLFIQNSIIYGCTTGVSQATAQLFSVGGEFNCFNNNTTNATNYTLAATDVTSNPTFSGASQITGTTATTSGSVLTQSGGDFSTVTDNVDYLRVTSGTGVTTGGYLITSHTGTTLTVNNALGTSSGGDVVYYVTTGHNFAIGTNLKAAGIPGAIGTETTAYTDMGAVQRQESAGGGSHTFGG